LIIYVRVGLPVDLFVPPDGTGYTCHQSISAELDEEPGELTASCTESGTSEVYWLCGPNDRAVGLPLPCDRLSAIVAFRQVGRTGLLRLLYSAIYGTKASGYIPLNSLVWKLKKKMRYCF
jgi:hypothetical protein